MAKKNKKSKSTDIVDIEKQMADQAKLMQDKEKVSGGRFFSTRAGQLSFDDTPLPGNQMAVIILAGIRENVYYEGDYDADNRSPPTCFAFGDSEDEMEPHEIVDKEDKTFTRQAPMCSECPQNEWGSADKGRGKACGNRRRLALIPAGVFSKAKGGFDLELIDDVDVISKADLAFMKLSVTSVKAWSKYVNAVADEFGKPPHGVITLISVEPDAKTQFKIHFEVIQEVPVEMLSVVMRRNSEAEREIDFPYVPFTEDGDDKPKKKGKKNKSRGKKLKGKK